MRVRHTIAAAAAILASVAWGASASAAPQHRTPAHHPILITHTMSSCGHMGTV
jgi:hypothetical protein